MVSAALLILSFIVNPVSCGREAPARQGQSMPTHPIAKSVAAAFLCASSILASPAAAQRVIRGYGADEDFQTQALAAGGHRQYKQQGYAAAYPQQRASSNYGGGL